ncbi:MAG: hypothetical protein PUI40_07630 [Oscillospiraceae bacterium]|nr:hypothetical protein [Oscillospiraceae bacterium]MDY2611132.1 hypothetical protein [Oscillospiraceae bacterium]
MAFPVKVLSDKQKGCKDNTKQKGSASYPNQNDLCLIEALQPIDE